MGSKIEYVDSSQIYATKYVRNSKAIGVLWGIFTICYAIINSVAFITQEWIGTSEVDYPVRFGLWSSCYIGPTVAGLKDCKGNLQEVFKFPLSASSVATLFAIVSVSLALLAVIFLLLFFFCASTSVYRICGWIQALSALCLITTVLMYPLGWNSSDIQETCGHNTGFFQLGDCTLGWAFFLAIIGCLDAIVLAILAFILAARHVKLQPEPVYGMNGSLLKGEINNAYIGDIGSTAGSRKSLNLHPVLLMPQPLTDIDRFSELSARTNRSKNSFCRPEFSSNIHNFQI